MLGTVGESIFGFLAVTQSGFYIGGPSISVPAKAAPGAALKASRFAVRTWHEGDAARVVVYAVVTDATMPQGELETAIATYSLALGARMTVTQTEPFGAVPVTLRVVPYPQLNLARP